MTPEIEIVYPDGRTERMQLTRQRTIVGRGTDADVRIVDKRISRQHCAIEVEGSQVYVVDLGGSNGTWIGKTKLLANVRESFPVESVVHVGPARLQRVSAAERASSRTALESQVFAPSTPSRPSGEGRPAAGGRAGSGSRDGSAAAVDLSQSHLAVKPGERGTLTLHISNQGKTVDHYTVLVSGVPGTWVTLPRTGLELLPRQEGTLTVDFHPPRSARTSAGTHRMQVVVKNQSGRVVAEASADLDVGAYENLSVDVRPNPYQSRSGGTINLTVENLGNAVTDYRVDVMDPSDGLQIIVEPPQGNLAPQQERQHLIRLKPRKRNWIGDAKRFPLTATVSSSQQSVDAMPTYIQMGFIPRWVPVILLLLCCGILPIVGYFGFNVYQDLRPTPTSTPTPSPTPVTPTPTITPDTPATITAEFCAGDLDGDRLLNCEEREAGTEPGLKDTDGDGLDDFVEQKEYNTDPLDRDSDADGISDGDEINFSCPAGNVLSPNSDDTDGDGIKDGADPEPCAGPTPTIPAPTPVPNFAYGAHMRGADDPDAFSAMSDARMEWVKVQIRFNVGDNPSSATRDILALKEEGLKVVVGLLGSRDQVLGGTPYYQAFGEFAAGIAAAADAIEVWNEPNIEAEWPAGSINPGIYVDLLRVAYQAIKAANPRVMVISAAPAPTGANGDTVMSDDRYIAGLMAAGVKNYLDCIGMHFNAGATPPNETSGHPADSNGHYSWYLPTMVDLYWETFNGDGTNVKPLCFTEFGYVSPDGFGRTLAQAGATSFTWAEGIDEFDQAVWLADALQRLCLTGKVGMFIVWNVNFTGDLGQDPQAGYAIIRPDGKCPACERLAEAVSALRVAGCMQ